MRGHSLAFDLARAVAQALIRIGVSQDEVTQGTIEHADLPWQTPPLVIEDTVSGIKLSTFIDRTFSVNEETLLNFYNDSLQDLRDRPTRCMGPEGYRSISSILPHVPARERRLYLSIPEGFPYGVTEHAGAILSLECAHLVRERRPITDFVSDDSNYYAVLESGVEIGIKDGLPTSMSNLWDLSVEGMVQEMLMAPRGEMVNECQWDMIDRVRSVVQNNAGRMRDFVAVDWALQALRVIGGASELVTVVTKLKNMASTHQHRVDLLRDAVEVSMRMALSDRQRIEILKMMFVPEVMTTGEFSKAIYPYQKEVPPTLRDAVITRIQNNVRELYEREAALYAVDLNAILEN